MGQWMSEGMSEGVSSVRGSDFRYRGNDFSSHWTTMHDGIETVNWVSGIFDNTLGTIGLDQRVGTGYDVSRTGFLLALVITGNCILVGGMNLFIHFALWYF